VQIKYKVGNYNMLSEEHVTFTSVTQKINENPRKMA